MDLICRPAGSSEAPFDDGSNCDGGGIFALTSCSARRFDSHKDLATFLDVPGCEGLEPAFTEAPQSYTASLNTGNWRLAVSDHDGDVGKLFYDTLRRAGQQPRRYAALHSAFLEKLIQSPGKLHWMEPGGLHLLTPAKAFHSECGWCAQCTDCWDGTWEGEDVIYCGSCWQSCDEWAFRDIECLCGMLPSEASFIRHLRLAALRPVGFVALSVFQGGKQPHCDENAAMLYAVGPNAWDGRLSTAEFLSLVSSVGRSIAATLHGFNAKCLRSKRIHVCRVRLLGGESRPLSTSKVDVAVALLIGLLCSHDSPGIPFYEFACDADSFRQAWESIHRATLGRSLIKTPSIGSGEAKSWEELDKVRFLHVMAPERWHRAVEVLSTALNYPPCTSTEAFLAFVSQVRMLATVAPSPGSFSALGLAVESIWGGPDAVHPSLSSIIRLLAESATNLPAVFPQGLPLLRQGDERAQFLSRRQCLALLAATLFGLVPKQDFSPTGEWGALPSFDVTGLLQGCESTNDIAQPVLCLLNYVMELAQADSSFLDSEFVSFARRMVPPELRANQRAFWAEGQAEGFPLCSVSVEQGEIESDHGALQADFANRFIGGGVLSGGLAQEEIRFLVSPECMAGCLFVEKMRADEAIFIVGALQFSSYSGYWEDFKFRGRGPRKLGELPLDRKGRREVHIVAFDALSWTKRRKSDQYRESYVRRELLKVYAACLGDLDDLGHDKAEVGSPKPMLQLRTLATGNWGCGAFKGDPQLKSLVQWLAASMAGRAIRYYPYGDERVKRLKEVVERIRSNGADCARLYAAICDCTAGRSVFEEVLERLEPHEEDEA